MKKLVARFVLRVLVPFLARKGRRWVQGRRAPAAAPTTSPTTGAAGTAGLREVVTRAVRSAWRLVDTPSGREHGAQALRWLRGADAPA